MLKQKTFDSDRKLYDFDILDSSGLVVGKAQLRLVGSKSASMPEGFESNVYYEVKPEHQSHGYATQALKELINIAKTKKISPLIATVNEDNGASIKVIENCAGKLLQKAKTVDGASVLKYELRP